MKKIKKIIISLVIIFIILTVILITLNKRIANKGSIPNEIPYDGNVITNNTLEKVSIRNNYYTVKNIVERYYSKLCSLNKTSENILVFEYDEELEHLEEEMTIEKDNSRKTIYSYFDEKCIKQTGLTIDNMQQKLGNYNDLYVLIEQMYVRDITETVKLYFVYGTLTEKENLKTEKFELMVTIDSNNSTFNIYTSEYIAKNNLYELSKRQDFKEKYFNINKIDNRKYNTYQFQLIDDETYAKDLLKSYTQSIKYNNIDYLYNKLNEEYKTNKFNGKSDYEKYVQENKENITTATLEYYKVSKNNGYKEYVCVDQNNKYYIFKEAIVMDYELILDIYTVDLPEFLEKYNSSTVQEKVALNIDRFMQAMNDKSYYYAYNCLADSYKNNYFKTQEEFETYAKQNFYENSKIEFKEFNQEGDVYTYSVILTDEATGNKMNKTFIVKLEEGTEFVLSFNV